MAARDTAPLPIMQSPFSSTVPQWSGRRRLCRNIDAAMRDVIVDESGAFDGAASDHDG